MGVVRLLGLGGFGRSWVLFYQLPAVIVKTDQFLLASNSDPKYTLLNSSFDVINIIRLWEISTKRLVRGRLVALDAAKKNQIANNRHLLQTYSNWPMGHGYTGKMILVYARSSTFSRSTLDRTIALRVSKTCEKNPT